MVTVVIPPGNHLAYFVLFYFGSIIFLKKGLIFNDPDLT